MGISRGRRPSQSRAKQSGSITSGETVPSASPANLPAIEMHRERERVRGEQAREKASVTFRDYANEYGEWSRQNKRSWRTDEGRIKVLTGRFGDKRLDEITSLEIERFRDSLLVKKTKATANRYRDLLSGMFKRAIRDGHLAANPVRTVSKFRENNERVTYLTAEKEKAVFSALSLEYRPHFLVSIHTGMRWSEQFRLRWQDVDLLAGSITIPRSKHGRSRRVPINSTARSSPVGPWQCPAATGRPDQSPSLLCGHEKPRSSSLEPSRGRLRHSRRPTSRHHTWTSTRGLATGTPLRPPDFAMAGVDPLTIKEVGGWRTLAMVQRYAHLAPGHLHEAVRAIGSAAAGKRCRTSP